MTNPDVSIVVPTYKEAENLRPLVEGVMAAMDASPSSAEMPGSNSSCMGAVFPQPGCTEAIARAIAVGAPSCRKPGSGLEPWEIGAPA